MYDDINFIFTIKAFCKNSKKDIIFKVNAPNYTESRIIEIISKAHPEYDDISFYYEDTDSNNEE